MGDTEEESGIDRRELPIVTVVIPAYNPGDLIFEAVDSVLGQTLSPIECIVVDNGSTDGLGDRLNRYGDRIVVVRFPSNRRPAAARNEGIRRARGDYIALLDADDVWMPTRLEKLVAYLEAHPEVGFATTDSYLLLGDTPTERSYFSTLGTTFHEENQKEHILRGNYLSNLLIFRRELFERYGLFDEDSWCEDWAKNIELIMGGERAGIVREPLSYYRVVPGSLSKSSEKMTADTKKILESWLEAPLDSGLKSVAYEAYCRAEWDSLKLDLQKGVLGDPVKGRLWKLAKTGPFDIKMKAVAWLILPAEVVGSLHRRRQEFIQREGGAWVFREAVSALKAGDRASARRKLVATILFGYPLRTRLTAGLWLLLPPLRQLLGSRLRSDPVLNEMGMTAGAGAVEEAKRDY